VAVGVDFEGYCNMNRRDYAEASEISEKLEKAASRNGATTQREP